MKLETFSTLIRPHTFLRDSSISTRVDNAQRRIPGIESKINSKLNRQRKWMI